MNFFTLCLNLIIARKKNGWTKNTDQNFPRAERETFYRGLPRVFSCFWISPFLVWDTSMPFSPSLTLSLCLSLSWFSLWTYICERKRKRYYACPKQKKKEEKRGLKSKKNFLFHNFPFLNLLCSFTFLHSGYGFLFCVCVFVFHVHTYVHKSYTTLAFVQSIVCNYFSIYTLPRNIIKLIVRS